MLRVVRGPLRTAFFLKEKIAYFVLFGEKFKLSINDFFVMLVSKRVDQSCSKVWSRTQEVVLKDFSVNIQIYVDIFIQQAKCNEIKRNLFNIFYTIFQSCTVGISLAYKTVLKMILFSETTTLEPILISKTPKLPSTCLSFLLVKVYIFSGYLGLNWFMGCSPCKALIRYLWV